ncbi:hypothetical protein QWM81_04385 [Streptomyces ficellus]|uniref:Uncharacterized protein n=1 Tax=Streptomyces ficellus TaxID=1977088 RepID=A0ABT7Z1C9_9ACTN|nr:hypothetical protein [Streptomyces ficellus]MDN3293298.1 hypothetical protein [Streptomyces ficellus]
MAVDSERNDDMRGKDALVGIKPRVQVEGAYRRLEHAVAAPGLRTPFSMGALAAYGWALGRVTEAPVTGAVGTGRVPSSHLLTAELDAAVVQLADPTESLERVDHVRGVHDALAWVCGLVDEQP